MHCLPLLLSDHGISLYFNQDSMTLSLIPPMKFQECRIFNWKRQNYWICSVSMKWTPSGPLTAVLCLWADFTESSLYIDFPIDLLEHLQHCAVLAACISLSLISGSFVHSSWLDDPVGRQRQLPKAVSVSSRGQTQSRETESWLRLYKLLSDTGLLGCL